jgi:hypothetical protein
MRAVRLLLIAALMLCFTILSGCADQKETMLKQGYPIAYVEGFDDGCHSGNKAGGSLFEQFKKDVNRFDSEKQYAQGWSDGFRQCETEQEALQRQIRMSIEQQQLSEARKNNELQEQYHLENQMFKDIDTKSLKALEK